MRERIAKWIAYAAIDWVREHGDEMLDSVIDWIASLVKEDGILKSAKPPEGIDPAYVDDQLEKLRKVRENAES